MKRLAIIAASLIGIATSAFAQASLTPSQMALQLDTAINQMAQYAEAVTKQNEDLNKKVEALQKENAELKAKYDPPAKN